MREHRSCLEQTRPARLVEGEKGADFVIREFAVRQLSADTALVTYRTVGTAAQEARRSSVWVRTGEEWKLAFHQGTRMDHL
ncbi:MAG TPA: DUF4440 domain-containing protein [Acidimicrobiia bacterium]|nr:DUF4440 domain-containing protein [Acidimicrobiia bacterium]